MSTSLIVFVVAIVSPLFVANVLVSSYQLSHAIQYDLELAEDLFQSFLIEHKKVYDDEEYKYRFKVFQENLKYINAYNKVSGANKLGINSLTDMSKDEFESMASCIPMDSLKEPEPLVLPDMEYSIPDELDYRKKGRVTAVKDQGSCGSCFIFASIGEIEGQYSIKHKLTAFSEQYPLDCSESFSCNGGYPHKVMEWLANTTGAIELKDYPDVVQKRKCHADPKQGVAKVKSYKKFKATADQLRKVLVDHGPVVIAIYATADLQHYQSGVINPADCDILPELNHAVTLVGYGKENEEDYWLIKNSWGEAWGEQGYLRLSTKSSCLVGEYVVTSEVL